MTTISISDRQEKEQYHKELLLRYIALSFYEYDSKKDISDFLDEINLKLLSESDASYQSIENSFTKTFKLINTTLGEKAFKKEQKGKFLESVFEAIAVGLSRNIDDYDDKNPNDITYLKGKIESLFQQDFYLQNAGSGSNAKSRINKMIPSSIKYFKRHE